MSDNFKFKVGDKINAPGGSPYEIIAIGNKNFLLKSAEVTEDDYEYCLSITATRWQLYQEPKKTKLVSPVIISFQSGSVLQDFQENVKPARVVLKNLRWIDKDGKPVGSDENQLEGDLFFEVDETK